MVYVDLGAVVVISESVVESVTALVPSVPPELPPHEASTTIDTMRKVVVNAGSEQRARGDITVTLGVP
jgi:hypothetical protein